MRWNQVGAALGVAIVALAAAACGSSPKGGSSTQTTAAPATASPKSTAQTELSSLASSRAAQLTFSIKSSSIPTAPSGVVKNPRTLVEGFRLAIDESADSNTTLAKAGSQVSAEIDIDYGTTALAKFLISDGKHAYFFVNTTGANALPLALSASDQQTVSGTLAILGGKWFQLPDSLLKAAESKAKTATTTPPSSATATTLNTKQALADVKQLEQDVLAASTVKRLNGTVVITGTLTKLEAALLPDISKIESSFGTKVPTKIKSSETASGSYEAVIAGNGTTLSGVTASLTTATGSGSVSLSVGHANIIVTAPANATPLPQSLLQEISAASGGA